MATKTKSEVVEEAKSLGIEFDEAATQKEIQALVDAIERDADKNPILSPEQQKRASDYVSEKLAAEQEKKRLQREAEGGGTGAALPGPKDGDPKLYSEDDVRSILKKMMAEMGLKNPNDEDFDEEAFAKKKIRLPRYQGKFVVGFNNMNTDEFFPDLVVQAFDIWDDQQKRMVAWVNLAFMDGSNLNVPLYSAITRSIKVECDLVEVKKNPMKIDNGRVEIMGEEKDYSRTGTGAFTRMKVKQDEVMFLIKVPGTGQEVLVGPEVVNW